MKYLNAKNPPIIKPGSEMVNKVPPPAVRAKSTPRPPEANEAIIIIKIAGFVAANPPYLWGATV